MAQEPKNTTPPSLKASAGTEPEIHVIPEEFYGAALKKEVPKEVKPAPAPPPKPQPQAPRPSRAPVVAVIVFLLLVVGGGFAYFNRDLLFGPPEPVTAPPPEPPTPPAPPAAPINASATSTSPRSVALRWEDASDNESGFRIERRTGTNTFVPLTSLPPNSTNFSDVSVSAEENYTYRVIALNLGGESEPSNETTATVQAAPPAPPVSTLPPAGLDADSDGLTDLEERLYVTDPQNPDSDSDSFLDGNEVFHLYNPAGQAPVRLLDSNLVKVQTGTVGWMMSIPTAWTMNLTSPQGIQATIDTQRGETFTLQIRDNPDRSPIEDWYVGVYGAEAQELIEYRSKGGYAGMITKDLLVTMIPWEDRVFVLTYNLNGQSFINYRTTYGMMLNSLVLSGMPNDTVPNGEPLPLEPGNATTSES